MCLLFYKNRVTKGPYITRCGRLRRRGWGRKIWGRDGEETANEVGNGHRDLVSLKRIGLPQKKKQKQKTKPTTTTTTTASWTICFHQWKHSLYSQSRYTFHVKHWNPVLLRQNGRTLRLKAPQSMKHEDPPPGTEAGRRPLSFKGHSHSGGSAWKANRCVLVIGVNCSEDVWTSGLIHNLPHSARLEGLYSLHSKCSDLDDQFWFTFFCPEEKKKILRLMEICLHFVLVSRSWHGR